MSVCINLTTVCRACLSETGPMKSLFTGQNSSTNNLPVNKLLQSCTAVQINKGDGLPQQICEKCITLAVQCYIFKKMVEETDTQLRQHLPTAQSNEIKAQHINQNLTHGFDSDEDLNSFGKVFSDDIDSENLKSPISPVLLLVVGNEDVVNENKTDKHNVPNKTLDKTTNTDLPEDADSSSITTWMEGKNLEKRCSPLCTDHTYSKALDSEENVQREKNYYHCRWCGEIFTAIEQYQKHVPEKHGSAHECEECHTTFLSVDDLSKHKFLQHSKPDENLQNKQDSNVKAVRKKRPATCTVCNKICRSPYQLNTHMLVHTGERPHMCDVCGKRFTQIPHLKTHYLTHTGVKNFICEICGKKYATITFLKSHMQQHDKMKKHKCPTCGKMFFQLSTLTAHIRIHTGERPYKCVECDKGFCSSSALKTHKLQRHQLEGFAKKPYICEKCGKRFTREVFLQNHSVMHRSDPPKIECEICGRVFKNKLNLKMHTIRHSASRPYMCNVCGRSFREESNLVSHIRFHSRPKPFECETCQKRFVDRGALRVHMRTHTGEKPFPCSVCDKRFTVKKSLDDHLRCHTGEKPFKCCMCDSSFTQRCSLQTHTLLVHKCDPQ